MVGCRGATGKTGPLLFILAGAASQPSYIEIQKKLVVFVACTRWMCVKGGGG